VQVDLPTQPVGRIGLDEIEREERELTKQIIDGLSGIKGVEIYGMTDTGSKRFNEKGPVITFRIKNIRT